MHGMRSQYHRNLHARGAVLGERGFDCVGWHGWLGAAHLVGASIAFEGLVEPRSLRRPQLRSPQRADSQSRHPAPATAPPAASCCLLLCRESSRTWPSHLIALDTFSRRGCPAPSQAPQGTIPLSGSATLAHAGTRTRCRQHRPLPGQEALVVHFGDQMPASNFLHRGVNTRLTPKLQRFSPRHAPMGAGRDSALCIGPDRQSSTLESSTERPRPHDRSFPGCKGRFFHVPPSSSLKAYPALQHTRLNNASGDAFCML